MSLKINQKKKNSFFRIKVSILSFLVFFILALILGYYFGSTSVTSGQRINLSNLYNVWDILDDKFLDVRSEDEKKDDNPKDREWGMIAGLVASYKDPYTLFLPPSNSKELKEEISGEFVGIGVELENKNGLLVVVSPLPGTPADRAGLKPKDVIVEIDGKDSVNIPIRDSVKMIRGEKETEVELSVVRKNSSDLLKIKVKRDVIKIPTIKTYKKDGVFVIKIFSFTEKVPELFLDAVGEYSKSGYDKLIIDMRGNPGGHLFASVFVAGLFLPEGNIVVSEDFGNGKRDILKSGQYHQSENTINIFSERTKVGILVDGGSASAAEILAGALHDHDRAILMGENTYGKGTVQEVKDLNDGSSLKYTIAKFILPSGEWISHKGIPVDIEIKISDDEIKEAKKNGTFSDNIDGQLNRAIEEMKKFESQEDIQKLIQKKRAERKKLIQKEREEKLKKILNKE